MTDQFSEEWKDTVEDLPGPDFLAWVKSVQLTEHEAQSIKKSIFEDETGYRIGLELMSTRIDRAVARSQRRIDQAVAIRLQLQTDRIHRRLTGSR
ncbi:hypothetical protein [Paenibacillus thermotolerans]|uniref:hypothetical protein n=1 Tax=Paenibacillus thermotolerans TaxID=3027807 RepID=UPI002368945E|nr:MULTISPECIES: hypothetical protein [unclassified Paenibacillus]